METFGYVHLYQLYEQTDEPSIKISFPPIASTMTIVLASSAISASTLTSVEARHLTNRPCDRETVSFTSVRNFSYLQLGSQGAQVYQIQTQLRNWGFPLNATKPLVIDGVFGAQTERAVREFQIYLGLTPDGIVGAKTMHALFSPRSSNEVLMLGSQGDRVLALQENLSDLGWREDLPLTGVFDRDTEKAIREFQSLVQLQSDGMVGVKTAAALTVVCSEELCGAIRSTNSLISWRRKMKTRSSKK